MKHREFIEKQNVKTFFSGTTDKCCPVDSEEIVLWQQQTLIEPFYHQEGEYAEFCLSKDDTSRFIVVVRSRPVVLGRS